MISFDVMILFISGAELVFVFFYSPISIWSR